jgi:hypothetical protein
MLASVESLSAGIYSKPRDKCLAKHSSVRVTPPQRDPPSDSARTRSRPPSRPHPHAPAHARPHARTRLITRALSRTEAPTAARAGANYAGHPCLATSSARPRRGLNSRYLYLFFKLFGVEIIFHVCFVVPFCLHGGVNEEACQSTRVRLSLSLQCTANTHTHTLFQQTVCSPLVSIALSRGPKGSKSTCVTSVCVSLALPREASLRRSPCGDL